MKKFLAILLLIVAIAACGNKEQPPVETEATETEMTTEVPAETMEMDVEVPAESVEMDVEVPAESVDDEVPE